MLRLLINYCSEQMLLTLFVVNILKNLVFVKPLGELRLSCHTIFLTNTSMAVTLAQFLWFLQNEGKWIEEVKIIISMGTLRAAQQTES